MSSNGFTVESHFVGKEATRKIYERLLKTSRKFGSVIEDTQEDFDPFEPQDSVRRNRHAQKRDHSHHQKRSPAIKSTHSQI